VESHISRKTSAMPGFPIRGTKQRPCAAFIEESRVKFINANKLHRKSGVWGTRPLLPVWQKI
jgi:hypothetical protein